MPPPPDSRRNHAARRRRPSAGSGHVPTAAAGGEIRLQRLLAMAGAGSRRHCEEFIQSGRVTIDGTTVQELGTRVDPDLHEVRLDGERVRVERPVYYLVHKPAGWLCTHRDPRGRPRVVDLCPQGRERLFTVGRLDEDSTGLMLVTNDGELAHRLAHPRFRIRKVYRVQVAGVPTREVLSQLREGAYFAEGCFKVADARFLHTKGQSAALEITLTEGQNREIRRLLARLGHKVQRLERVGLGTLALGSLPVGGIRPLAAHEISELRALAFGQGQTARPRTGRRNSSRHKARSRKGPSRR
ncbi:MAG: pseudouridine synthase [Planctomycetaceae bacterium]